MKRIVCNTRFKLDSFADGGSKRSVQIREMLAENGLTFEDDVFQYYKSKELGKLKLIRLGLRSIGFVRNNYHKKAKSISEYIRMVKYYALRVSTVDKYVNQNVVFLWENTCDHDMLCLVKATGNRVIGMPHNVESLVNEGTVEALSREIESLKLCDITFVISKEETWLLRLLGVNAYYLPYYPPKEAERFLLSIRQKREKRIVGTRKSFLLLGSAGNIPTQKGMQSMIDFFGESLQPFDLNVAGYETESLEKPDNPTINFYGTVSNSKLEKILCETDAVLIFQPPTTGALTRIPEMLLAGVPVFVNFDASRNYFNIKDVRMYDSFEDLKDQLQSFESHQAVGYKRDDMAIKRFVELTKELVYE